MPKAMILAAGLGSRLKPMTDHIPKALIEFRGRPLIEYVIDRLSLFGYNDFIVNLHHHGAMLSDFLEKYKKDGMKFSFSDESQMLLDTGGAINKAQWFFDDDKPFLVHNCDVVSTIALDEMRVLHLQNSAVATLAVSPRNTSRPLAFDQKNCLRGRFEPHQAHLGHRPLAFSGIYILDPAIFSFMPQIDIFSIIDVLLLASQHRKVMAYVHDPAIWLDAGSPQQFQNTDFSIP